METLGATVRRAGPRDAAALCEVLNEYFAEGDVNQIETEATLSPQLQSSSLGFYVAEAEGEIAGCVLCRPLPSKAQSAECKRLFVRPGFRDHGLASLLMDMIETEAREAGFTWLYLDSKDNFDKALAMYRRRGYVACERFNDNPQATFSFARTCLR